MGETWRAVGTVRVDVDFVCAFTHLVKFFYVLIAHPLFRNVRARCYGFFTNDAVVHRTCATTSVLPCSTVGGEGITV